MKGKQNMVMIQQTMDFYPGARNDIIGVLSKKNVEVKADEKKTAGSYQSIRREGNISVSAFCIKLESSGIMIGRNQMFKWLRKNGYISKQKGTWNMPLQKYVKEGIFDVKETFVLVADEQVARYSPLITPKGRAYLTDKLKKSAADGTRNKKSV